MSLKTLRLPDRLEHALRTGHPWIYRNHLPDHRLESGAWVRVEAGAAVAFGRYDAEGAIAIRLFSWQAPPDEAWLRAAARRAAERRALLARAGHTAYRLLHGEGDGLPAIVADRYGRFVIMKSYAGSVEALLPPIAAELARVVGAKGVAWRRGGTLEPLVGELPPPEETVREHGLRFLANPWRGQKTGLFLDHREHRQMVREYAEGRRVLNLFAYQGAFSVYALAGGAREAWSVDSAEEALRDAERNVALNDLDASRHRAVPADAFRDLDRLRDAGERFDLVVVDPPSLAHGKRQRARALSAYRSLNARALRLLTPGGLLATGSCTAQVGPAAFERAVRDAARGEERRLRLQTRGAQPADHPAPRHFPEGRYLKFLIFEAS